MKYVGVIGGGAAGLCAARHILSYSGLTPIIWEQTTDVGGTWVHNPNTGDDANGLPIHSSMYNNLRTNLPKEIMQFPDYPFAESDTSFIHHTEVLKYLKDYATHFNILDQIKFSHHVDWVEPVTKDDEFTSWQVSVSDLQSNKLSKVICDALIICNGHYSVPNIPAIPFIEDFEGTISHSHDYREPSIYKDKNVILLGAGASGIDIALEVCAVAKKVYLSHNRLTRIPSKLPDNLVQVSGIKEAKCGSFLLNDERIVEADFLMYCTGYKYNFPFLSSSCGIKSDDYGLIWPLYEDIISCQYPSMAFIGIPSRIVPFPLFDMQLRYFLKSFAGNFTLPSKYEMEEVVKIKYEKHISKTPAKYFHLLADHQWEYNDHLAKEAGLEPLKRSTRQIYEYVWSYKRENLVGYKDTNFKILTDDSYEIM